MDNQAHQILCKRRIKLERIGRWDVALALLLLSSLLWTEYELGRGTVRCHIPRTMSRAQRIMGTASAISRAWSVWWWAYSSRSSAGCWARCCA
jgi:hypothetical protein